MHHFPAKKNLENRCQFSLQIAEDVEADSYGGQRSVCCHHVHSHGHTPMIGFKDTKEEWMVLNGPKEEGQKPHKLKMESETEDV